MVDEVLDFDADDFAADDFDEEDLLVLALADVELDRRFFVVLCFRGRRTGFCQSTALSARNLAGI
ncbi:MAG: hypothetical protein ACREPM_04655, partial [Gemmatimonadaceae bacterium]